MSKRVLSIVLTICMLGTVLFFPQPAHAAADQPVSEIAQAALKLIRDNEGSYGSVNKNDNGALSIGFLQWHADRALSLMRIIVNANKKQAKNILGTTLYNEITNTSTNWDKRTVNTTEAVAVSKLLTTPQGREAQDKQALQNITSYIDHGIRLGIKSASALVYFADLENQGGAGGSAGAAKLAASKAGAYAKITLYILHNATKNHYLGSYITRRNKAYDYCKDLNWDKKTLLDVNVRIYGADRYATSLEIANAYKKALGVSRFSAVCVADGVNFPDALAGAYFASINKAPIIAIRQNAPTGQQTMNSINYIKGNLKKGGTVYILGGSGSVPTSIETTLKEAGFKVERLWGQNRYLSNIAILKAANVKAGSEIIVTTGTTFVDALSASATGKPVLLMTGNALTKEQKAYLAKVQAEKITIVGTTKDVSMGIEKQLKQYVSSVSRISAATAYERSVAVAKKYFPGTQTHINIADGRKFPDALCAGPLAIKKGSPLLLTNGSFDVDYQIRVYAKSAKTTKTTVYGGPASVDDASPKYILGIN